MAEISHVLTEGGGGQSPPLSLRPLKMRQSFNPEQVGDALENIRHALTLDLPQFEPTPTPRRGSMILVGGGPSLADSLPAIKRLAARRHSRLIAFNDAITFLIGHGIYPWGSVFMEVAPWRPEFMKQVPVGLTYLMASQCHPETYEKMRGSKIIQWHAAESIGEEGLVFQKFGGRIPLVPGGVTALTRALFIGHAMGFRRFELFGADSSHGESSHAYYDREGQGVADVFCAGKWFKAPGYLARQCEDLTAIVRCHHPTNMKIRVHCGGMFGHVAMTLGIHAKSEKRT